MEPLVGQPFTTKGGFDASLSGALTLTHIDPGCKESGRPAQATAEVVVTPALTNAYNTLHGGAIATLVRHSDRF